MEGAGIKYDQFDQPLNESRLFEWHNLLMQGNRYINIGQWRQSASPMQIVSGAIGKETVHFEAPPSSIIPHEMQLFFNWCKIAASTLPVPIYSAIAHLYFESIHPFEDGNGRIGRAISEKILSKGINRPVLLSLSRTIAKDRSAYYNALQKGQRSNEVTDWILYFLRTAQEAQQDAVQYIQFTLEKTRFFDQFSAHLNDRQEKVLQKMLITGWQDFEGGINAKKYASISKISKATATRDLVQLMNLGILKRVGDGRSTRYEVVKV